jgi:hypothetical protein
LKEDDGETVNSKPKRNLERSSIIFCMHEREREKKERLPDVCQVVALPAAGGETSA